MASPYQILADTRRLGGGAAPQVSLIVPVYNVERYVADCLLSILANAVNVALELIIIDDGSQDGSVQVIAHLMQAGTWPETLLLRQENRGLSAVRNLGARLARGDYLGFLDSDDWMMPGSLPRMAQYAGEMDGDIVLGRSLIVDSRTRSVKPFYDQLLWDALLAGQSDRVLEASQYPSLLSLEPNANYRLIRRQFLIEQRLSFPEGLLFEDAPVHFRMLLKAKAIGLLDLPYYGYRVNRPGKITDEKTQRRFDMLQIARLAIAELKSCHATADQGGAALRVLFRLLWWCGTMIPSAQRPVFFKQACEFLSSAVPPSWLDRYLSQNCQDIRHVILGVLLAGGGASILVDFSSGRSPVLALARFILGHGHAKLMARSGWIWLQRAWAAKTSSAN